ncbi:hypothetical protein DWW90_03930 [Parabacteroides sp. AF17-28]|nr:hypothetical protein DWW90_03930 [Parabacteroides sp. AF17-28]
MAHPQALKPFGKRESAVGAYCIKRVFQVQKEVLIQKMSTQFSAVKKGLFPVIRHLIAIKRDFIALIRNFVALKSDFI